jgi:hypothetical protein
MKRSFLLIALFGLSFAGNAQNASTFDYKVKRGTVTWDTLKNYEERRSLCQIPHKVIGSMTTIDLLNSVLDYPLLADAFIFNSYRQGFDKIAATFYALDSLLKRKDVKTACIAVYDKFKPADANAYKEILPLASFMFKMNFLELLIAQKEVYSNFTADEKNAMLKLLTGNYSGKKALIDKFDNWGLSTIGWASSRICNIDVVLKNDAGRNATYIDAGYTINIEALDEIMNKAQMKIK